MYNEAKTISPESFFLSLTTLAPKRWIKKQLRKNHWHLFYVPDHFKTQEMCEKAVRKDSYSLQYVPDWSVTEEQTKTWNENFYLDNNNELST